MDITTTCYPFQNNTIIELLKINNCGKGKVGQSCTNLLHLLTCELFCER